MGRNREVNQRECQKIAEFIENQTTKLRKSAEFDENTIDVLVRILESCCKLASIDLTSFSTTILYAVDLIKFMKRASCEIAKLHRIYEERIPSMTKYLAELVSTEPCLPAFRTRIFSNWIAMLRYTTVSIRKFTVMENLNFMKQVLHAVFTTGHFNTQFSGFEIFLKYLSGCKGNVSEVLESVIPPDTDSLLKTMIQNFDYRRFDTGARKFLNYYNMKVCSGSVPVYSVISNKGQLGSTGIAKPVEEDILEDLWLDFNSQTNTIGFYCDSSTFMDSSSFWVFVDLHIIEIIFDKKTNLLKIIIDKQNTTCEPPQHKPFFSSAKEAVFEINSAYVNKKLIGAIMIMNNEAKRKTPFQTKVEFKEEKFGLEATEMSEKHAKQVTPKKNIIKFEPCRSEERYSCSPSSKGSNDSHPHICTQINKQLSQLNLNENLRNEEMKREPSNKRRSTDREIPSIPIKRSPEAVLSRNESQKMADLNVLQEVKPDLHQFKQPNTEEQFLNVFRQKPLEKAEGKTATNAVNDQLYSKLWKKRKLYTARSFLGTPNSIDTQIQRRKYLEERRKKEANIRTEFIDFLSPTSNPGKDIIVNCDENADPFTRPPKEKVAEENKRKLLLLRKKMTPPHLNDPFCQIKQCCDTKKEGQKGALLNNEGQNGNAGGCRSDTSTEIFELVDDEVGYTAPQDTVLPQNKMDSSQYSLRMRENRQLSPQKNSDMTKLTYGGVAAKKCDEIEPSSNRGEKRAEELRKVLGTDSQKDEIVISESETSSVEEVANEPVSTPKNLNGSQSSKRIPVDKSKNLRKIEERLEQQQQDQNSEITDRAWVMKHFFDCLKDKDGETAPEVPREVAAGANVDVEVISVQGSEDAGDDEIDLIIKKSGLPSLMKNNQASQFRQLLTKFKMLMDPKFENIIDSLKKDSPLMDMTEFAKELEAFLESYDLSNKKAAESYGKIKNLWEQISKERETLLKAMKQSDKNFSNMFSRLNSLLNSVKSFNTRSGQVYENSVEKVTDEGKDTLVTMWKEIVGNMAHEAHDSIVKHINDEFL